MAAAPRAGAVGRDPVVGDPVADAVHQEIPAAGAAGGGAVAGAHVAQVDVGDPGVAGDGAGPLQGGGRRARGIQHPVRRVEGREVHGHLLPELGHDPGALGGDLVVGVIAPGDEQGGDLQPGAQLPHPHEGVEHVVQAPAGHAPVEVVGEALEVDIGGVDGAEELVARSGADPPRGDGHGQQPHLVAGDGGVDGVLGEDDRVVVGEGHPHGSHVGRGPGQGPGGGGRGEGVELPGGGDLPVLAVLARQVAARRPEGQDRRAGQHVRQGLLLDGVQNEAGGAPVGGQHNGVPDAGPHEAEPALAVAQGAPARAQLAAQPPVRHGPPPPGHVAGPVGALVGGRRPGGGRPHGRRPRGPSGTTPGAASCQAVTV